MGVEYILVNRTKAEKITFTHLNGSKKLELAGNAAQSSVVTWYLLNNQGNEIQFVSDTYNDWPFSSGGREEVDGYNDVTDSIVSNLIDAHILKDNGFLYQDENEPKAVYIRDIVNIWTK